MSRSIKLYVNDIIEAISRVEKYTENLSFDEFVKDTKTVDAIIHNLSVIGEAARHIPEELQEKDSGIPWHEIVSMRNKVIHEYFGVDEEILWTTIQKDLPSLKQKLKKLPDKIS